MASTKKPKEEMEEEKERNKKEVAIRKSKQEEKRMNNKTSNRSIREPVVLLLSSSSSSSGGGGGGGDIQEIIETDDETNSGVKSFKIKRNNKRKGKEDDFDGEEEEEGNGTACRFPMARIKRIIKSEDSDSLLGQDAVFLVNKATEKFVELFSEEAYRCSVQDRKKSLGYKHLSTVVSKRRRFDFLSDFVPEKLKVGDALAERKLAETGQG